MKKKLIKLNGEINLQPQLAISTPLSVAQRKSRQPSHPPPKKTQLQQLKKLNSQSVKI